MSHKPYSTWKLEVAASKMVMMMVIKMIIDLKGRVMEPAKPVVGQGKLVTANLWLQ